MTKYTTNQQFWLYWCFCIPIRLLQPYLAYKGYGEYLRYATGFMSVAFLYRFIMEERKKRKGIKMDSGAFGSPPFWHYSRLLYAFTYGLYTINYKHPEAYKILLFQIVIGAMTQLCHHYC